MRRRSVGSRGSVVAAATRRRPAVPRSLAATVLPPALAAAALLAAHSAIARPAVMRPRLRDRPAASALPFLPSVPVASGRPPLRYRPVGCRATGLAAVYAHGPRSREIALTFDDGPSTLTRRFVRMLRANGAVATFFLVGEHVSPRRVWRNG